MRVFKISLDDLYGYNLSTFMEYLPKYFAREKLLVTLNLVESLGHYETVEATTDAWRGHIGSVKGLVITEQQMVELTLAGEKVNVEQEIDIGASPSGIVEQFTHMVNKLEGLLMSKSKLLNPQYNERCNVHMPGQALATYNEVKLLEDACSDHLQTDLDNGWRMIAACPQPDNRRPDYILGRFNPKREEANSSAQR